mmetsp:Transcript_16628/g.27349  ORF Transcript_16628/g.27349 Transcript_16628/m.27349 type:complete len:269 (+) Transcript_16628:582-1388(+)
MHAEIGFVALNLPTKSHVAAAQIIFATWSNNVKWLLLARGLCSPRSNNQLTTRRMICKLNLLHSSKCSSNRRMITIKMISLARGLLHKCSSRTLIHSNPLFVHSSKYLSNRTTLKCRMNFNPSLLRSSSSNNKTWICSNLHFDHSNKVPSSRNLSLLCQCHQCNRIRLIYDHNQLNKCNNNRIIFSRTNTFNRCSRIFPSPQCNRTFKISPICSQCRHNKVPSSRTNSSYLSSRITFSHKMISGLQRSNSPFSNRMCRRCRHLSTRSK